MAKRKHITTTQAAQEFDLSPGYVARLAAAGTIKAEKWGRDWLIEYDSIAAYCQDWRKRKPGPRKQQQKEGQK